MRHKTEIKVRYAETDQMGVVYHTNYLVWFEVARTEMMYDHNVNYSDVEKNGVFMPVIEANCQYKKSARYGETVTIETNAFRQGRTKVRFEYSCLNKKKELLAVGFTTHAFMNKSGRPVRSPDIFENFEKMPKSAIF